MSISLLLVTPRQSLLSLHMTKSYVRTATRSTLKVEANPTQILNFKANFHTEFEPFFKKKIYANNGGHFGHHRIDMLILRIPLLGVLKLNR